MAKYVVKWREKNKLKSKERIVNTWKAVIRTLTTLKNKKANSISVIETFPNKIKPDIKLI